jgi:glycerophosphoryl diester phosphodiesterase
MLLKPKEVKNIVIVLALLILIPVLVYFYFGGLHKNKSQNLLTGYDDQVLIFAHRGTANYFPENSFEAIQNAGIKNFKAIEIDINETSDSVIILFHDEDCERMLGIKGNINSHSFKELKNHPYIFNSKATGNYILTLDETLKYFGKKFIIYIDIKNRTYDFMKKVIGLIKKYNLERSTILASAHFLLIARIEFDFPEINTCLEGFNSGKEWIYYFIPADFKPDYFASFIQNTDKKHIDWIKENNLLYNKIVYGVDTSNYLKAKELGLKKILIDYDSTINMQNILK